MYFMEKGFVCTTNPDSKTVFGARKENFGMCVEYGILVSESNNETKGEIIIA